MVSVAVFRPKNRLADSRKVLKEFGFDMLALPLLEPVPTGKTPKRNADFVIYTSAAGARFTTMKEDLSKLNDPTVCAIGPKTAEALRKKGVSVDVVPDRYSSLGLVQTLSSRISGKKVEIARSSEGSDVLPAGLNEAGAFVHLTELYELRRLSPSESEVQQVSQNAEIFLFTSSLIARHFLNLVGDNPTVEASLREAFVGAIGEPTGKTLTDNGLSVDLIASEATFEELVEETHRHWSDCR